MDFLQRILPAVILIVGVFLLSGYLLLASPLNFSPATLMIKAGTSASDISKELADAHVVVSPIPLWLLLRVSGGDSKIRAGTYRFAAPEDVFSIQRRLVTADYGLPPVRITFTEGVTVREAAAQVAAAVPGIAAHEFLVAGRPYEGYLFPDTYFLPPSSDAASIIATMRANFDAKLAPLASDIAASGHSLGDIIIMASLIEKEARTDENRHIVAGILWNRLARGMPLQVDAVFGYIFDRDTYSPSFADLKVDSLYNTYMHKGLPPGPIANPGLDAIDAALHPTKTNYLYYLTGTDTVMHYATTYADHQANRKKYLK